MPRKPRLDAPGLVQHVIVRGIEHRDIFIEDADRHEFLRRLSILAGHKNNHIYAFCLMSNHVHILVRTLSMSLATFMSRLLTGYALYFNRQHKRAGHLFQNRYKSFVVDEESYLLELIRYIHLNPLRAGIVNELDALMKWPYGGHSVLMGRVKLPWYGSEQTLSLFGDTRRAAQSALTEFMADGLGMRSEFSGGGLRRSINALPQHGQKESFAYDERILGVGNFVEELLSSLEKSNDKDSTEEKLDRLLDAVAARSGLSFTEMCSGSKRPSVAQARATAVYCAIRHTTVSTTELARILGITRAGVCAIIRSGRGEAMGCTISP